MTKKNIFRSIKENPKPWQLAVIVLCAIGILCLLFFGFLRHKTNVTPSGQSPTYSVFYENCVPKYDRNDVDFVNSDVREVQVGTDQKYLINHSRGFALGFPLDAEFDFSAAQEYIRVHCENMSCVVSKEYTVYTDGKLTKQYVDESLHKFILNDKFRQHNKITLLKNSVEKIGDYWMQMVALERTPAPGSEVKYNTYVYCYIYTDSTMFYRLMFKLDDYNDKNLETIYKTLYSFSENVPVVGVSSTFTDFKPVPSENWNKETRDFYNELSNTDTCKWGIYTPWAVFDNDFTNIHKLEKKVDTKFEGVLEYKYYWDDMPIEGMKKAHEEGKVIELTLQVSTIMNEDLDGYTPMFDLIDGVFDERIRKTARQIADFGHPVLFRLNNEMNSDWTSYSSSVCLTDPEIFIEGWRRIYRIFEEEGVKNAIWVFNPNNESFPPNGYNHSTAFYPGNEYVHVFGITGYNTGSYYEKVNGEKWRSFDDIYTEIYEKNKDIYGEFPWIITEFSSSSVGGDKEKWISDMFRDLKKFPNIKMAFWFSSADYEKLPDGTKVVARPYWLDETDGTARAFSEGLKKAQSGK